MVPLCVCGRSRWREQRRLHRYSHVLAETRESLVFRDHVDKRRAGSVSMETSSMEHNESSRPINPRTKGTTNDGGSSLQHVFCWFFFLLFLNFLLFNRRFFGSSVVFFRSLFSSASLKYSHTGNQKCLCLVCQDATNKKIKNKTEGKKKALHIYIKKFWGDSTFFFFSGSPHSLHTWVSHGSVFWWSVTWLVIFWSPSVQIWKQVCRNESSLTVLTGGDGDWSPASGAGSLVSVSVRVIN